MRIKVLCLDLALSNAGMSVLSLPLKKGTVDLEEIKVEEIKLVKTEKSKTKEIRRNSDDLARLKEISQAVKELHDREDVVAVFAEIPSGAQSARAALTFGAVLGILSTIDKPLIQVQKDLRGMVVADRKVVAKTEVIEWAARNWPDAGWEQRAGRLIASNEHVADSIAIGVAGLKTTQWQENLRFFAMSQHKAGN